MEPRPAISPALGLAVGLASAVPFAVGSILVVDPTYVFSVNSTGLGVVMAISSVVSGGVTGASFGRLVAARPTIWRVLGAVALAVVIGTVVGVYVDEWWHHTGGNFFGIMLLALAIYGSMAFFVIGLPAFLLGMAIARRLAPR